LFASGIDRSLCCSFPTRRSSDLWIFIGLFRGLQEGPTITGNILNKTLRQSIVPNNILGRVNAVNGSLSVVSYPLSGFLAGIVTRSEEHTSEIQSHFDVVCRILLI